MNIFKNISNFIKNNYIKIILAIAVIICIWFILSKTFFKKDESTSITKVIRTDMDQIVEVSGAVEPSQNADINFEKSGIVQIVKVKVGDAVRAGQVLATISGSDAYSAVREAEAGVQSAQAALNDIKSGATEEELNIRKQSLENAKLDLNNINTQVQDTISNTENNIRDIIDFKMSSIFYKDSINYKMSFNGCDQTSQFSLEQERSTFDDIKVTSIENAKSEADRLSSFTNKISNFLSLPCAISDKNLSDERATISGIKSSTQLIFSEISAKKSLLQNAKNSIARAERDLDLISAGANKNKIAISNASLSQAYARLATAKSQASKNILTAPFSGIVSQVNIEKGELASMSKSAISIISNSKYQIKSKIAEADISKISVNDKATVTVDAYPGEIFLAIVTNVDPASTNDSGVPRYGVTLTFLESYGKLKSGMTANADIVTDKKEKVLQVPVSFIIIKSGGGILKVKTATGTEDKIVKVGIRSQDGKVEILEGVNEGEEILEQVKEGEVKR